MFLTMRDLKNVYFKNVSTGIFGIFLQMAKFHKIWHLLLYFSPNAQILPNLAPFTIFFPQTAKFHPI
jgi:hypothetical protein